jgi:hypothetical protein
MWMTGYSEVVLCPLNRIAPEKRCSRPVGFQVGTVYENKTSRDLDWVASIKTDAGLRTNRTIHERQLWEVLGAIERNRGQKLEIGRLGQ